MINYQGRKLLTTAEASQVLGKSTECLRQMIYRKKFRIHKVGNRTYIDLDQVSTHYPSRLGLPLFETKPVEYVNEEFLSFDNVRSVLDYTPVHLRKLIKSGKLMAFCTSDGQVLISQSSLNKYLGVGDSHAEASNL